MTDLVVDYAPEENGRPDPGEVVWAWVAYEDDPSRGKDRPVLVLARDETRVLALQLTSVDHDRDAAQEAAAGRFWMDVGRGRWDREGRPSEVRLNRLLHLDPASCAVRGRRSTRRSSRPCSWRPGSSTRSREADAPGRTVRL